MNYNSKRLTNPLKPICKCRKAEFNTLVDIVRGSTSTKEHNKNFAFKKAMEELTSPCTDKDKDSLTLAELVMKIPYPIADEEISIDCDVFDGSNDGVKPDGFFVLVGNDNNVKQMASIYYYDNNYRRYDPQNPEQEQIVNSLRFPLTDKDIMLIKEGLKFEGIYGIEWMTNEQRKFKSPLYTGTIYMYKLN